MVIPGKPGILGGIGRFFARGGGLFRDFIFFFLRFWHYTIFAIIIVSLFYGGIKESVETGDVKPLAKSVGLRILASDAQLYLESHRIIQNKGIMIKTEEIPNGFFGRIKTYLSNLWETFVALGSLIANIYLLGFMFWLFYKTSVIFGVDASSIMSRIIFAMLLIVTFSIIGGLLVITPEEIGEDKVSYVTKLIPVRGVIEFFKATPFIIDSTIVHLKFLTPMEFQQVEDVNLTK